MPGLLTVEREYLKENQEALRKEHPGKYLVTKGTDVRGAYETRDEAIAAGVRTPLCLGAAPLADPAEMRLGDSNS